MAIVNKDLIQSYIMTTAKYDFNVYEKRIIYRLVEMAQGELQGIKFADNCQKIEHDLFSCVNITMPIACLLNGEDDKNYARVNLAKYLYHSLTLYTEAFFSLVLSGTPTCMGLHT